MRATPFPQPARSAFADYGLLDSGGGEKLERFGTLVLRRPDPQALWAPRLSPSVWKGADFAFERESDRGGRWLPGPGRRAAEVERAVEEGFDVRYSDARLRLRLTPFKHVGLFPEQAANWELVTAAFDTLASERPQGEPRPRLLNLFGYTGALSVVARQAGYEVTHVDASRLSLTWAVENAELSGLGREALRVVLEDALAFVRREVRRGSRYDVVALDPPHYGRGPKGQKWQFETDIVPLLDGVRELVAERALVVLSTYAIGFSPLALENLFAGFEGGAAEAGELALEPEAKSGEARRALALPAGFCARWSRGLELDGAPRARS